MAQPVIFLNLTCFNPAQLIVGPSKINTNFLRQTDGERFFDFCKVREFSREFEPLSNAFGTIKTQNLTSTYV